MLKRLCLFAACAALELSLVARVCSAQQSLCKSGIQDKLYCLIPNAFLTPAQPFAAVFTPFGTDLSQLPIARPAGIILELHHGVGTSTPESLGPVFAGRAETVGRGRLFLGETYQYFKFQQLDGNNLSAVPIVLTLSNGSGATVTNNSFNINASQYTFLAAFGVSDRLDLSVAVPVQRIAMGVNVSGTEYEFATATLAAGSATFSENAQGTASGFGDTTVGAKLTALDTKAASIAGGVDFRIPTGDELNFLGSGTVGVRPYVAISRHGALSPHLNLGYQWNGNSILNPDVNGNKQQLPTDFFYVAGVDATFARKVTIIVDLLGRRVFNSPRLSTPTTYSSGDTSPSVSAPSVQSYISSYVRNDLSLGFKTRFSQRLVFTANAVVKLDNNGLRSRVVPLAGLSYTFKTVD